MLHGGPVVSYLQNFLHVNHISPEHVVCVHHSLSIHRHSRHSVNTFQHQLHHVVLEKVIWNYQQPGS